MMVLTQGLVTIFTVYFFVKVLTIKPKSPEELGPDVDTFTGEVDDPTDSWEGKKL